MEQFVVSARKYRPSTFESVVGQSHITTTLKNALRNRQLAQAFLFCGPRGVGKTTCARILAKTINCLNPTEAYEACGVCESCQAIQKNASLSIYELDAASNNSVDDIRNLVEQVRFPPQLGSHKVYIIDEVHMLSTSAFNAFLKTLEEPPSYVIFILATTEKHKIIPTILSRCQIFDFKRIEVEDMAQHLASIAQKEGIEAEYDALELIAQKADGGLRDALSLFDMIATFSADHQITYQNALENLHVLDYEYYFKISDALLREDLPEALVLLDDIVRRGFDPHNFISGLCHHFRDLMVCKNKRTLELLRVPQKAKKEYLRQADEAPLSFLLSALQITSQAELNYKNSKDPRLLIELALMKIAHLPAALRWADTPAEQNQEELPEKKKSKPLAPETEASSTPVEKKEEVASKKPEQKPLPTTPKEESGSLSVPLSLDALSSEVEGKEDFLHQQEENQPFDMEALRDCVAFFKRIHRDPAIDRVLNRVPRILEGNQIVYGLTENEQSVFRSFEQEFLRTLKKRLRNQQITLKMEALEEVEVRPYSNVQKYDYLLKKHPMLAELKERLGLAIDA